MVRSIFYHLVKKAIMGTNVVTDNNKKIVKCITGIKNSFTINNLDIDSPQIIPLAPFNLLACVYHTILIVFQIVFYNASLHPSYMNAA